MNYSKAIKTIIFLLTLIASFQIGFVFKTERLIQAVENMEPTERILEPVIIERIPEETEPEPEPEVIEETEVQPRITCRLNDEIQQMIVDKCEEYDIDFAFAMAVIFKESSFKPNVISNSNDYGLMQINKINHEWLSEELGITDFLDPEQNVTAGLHILQDLFEKYEYPSLVLMAYNMGETGAKRLWVQGIYSTDYAEGILQQADRYENEIAERMGE